MTITKQEIYDTVVRNLHAQGRPAVDHRGHCMYRTAEGLKCAVGGMIPDDKYTPDLEGRRVSSDSVLAALPNGVSHHLDLLRQLQDAHDLHWTGGDDAFGAVGSARHLFVRELIDIAYINSLNAAVLAETFGALQAS